MKTMQLLNSILPAMLINNFIFIYIADVQMWLSWQRVPLDLRGCGFNSHRRPKGFAFFATGLG